MTDELQPKGDVEPQGDLLLPTEGAGDKTGTPAAGKSPDDKGGDKAAEAVDEKGVPWKNRVAEKDRKLTKVERELEMERAQRAELERRMTAAFAEPARTVDPPDLATTILTEPEKFQQATVDAAVRLSEWKQYQVKLITDAMTEFPDLKDRDSEFFREVSEEYESRKRYFGRDDAAFLRDAAATVDRRKLKEKVKPTLEASPPMGERGSQPSVSGGGKRVVTEAQKTVARELGLSDAEAADVYSRDQSESVA